MKKNIINCPLYMTGKHHFTEKQREVKFEKGKGQWTVFYPMCKCGLIDDREKNS